MFPPSGSTRAASRPTRKLPVRFTSIDPLPVGEGRVGDEPLVGDAGRVDDVGQRPIRRRVFEGRDDIRLRGHIARMDALPCRDVDRMDGRACACEGVPDGRADPTGDAGHERPATGERRERRGVLCDHRMPSFTPVSP